MKPLNWCANGCKKPPKSPSLVICEDCLNGISNKFQAMIDKMQKRRLNMNTKITGLEMLQRMYDSELTFSISSDWDGGFTLKVGCLDPYGEKWAEEHTCIYGIEFALAELLSMVVAHYPGSKFTQEMEGVTVVCEDKP